MVSYLSSCRNYLLYLLFEFQPINPYKKVELLMRQAVE
jgi:hypothetical protein